MKTKAIFISLSIVTFLFLATLALASTQIIWDQDTVEVVLTPGTYSWEDDRVTDPHVIYDNGVYKMWYRGWGTWPDPDITFYEDAIGYATSTDGVNWSDRQLSYGPKPGYPQTKSPFVIKEGSNYRMWVIDYYESLQNQWSGYVSHMTSSDGVLWVDVKKVLSAQGQSEPQGDGYNIYSVCVLDEGSHYTMWYSVQDLPDIPSTPPNRLKIWRATSIDGIYWPLENRQLSMPYVKDTWEDNVRHPHVVRDNNGGYTMYYAASYSETWNLAAATSEDGITWNNRQQIGVNGENPSYFEDTDGTPYLYFNSNGEIFRISGNRVPVDTDEDGIPDDEDECPNSDLSPTVVIDGCDSGVPNTLFGNGCTISDNIAEFASDATNSGKFVKAVAHYTNKLKKDGVITKEEKKAIQSCAGQADIP